MNLTSNHPFWSVNNSLPAHYPSFLVIFVSLIFWTWLWGVPGALLSVPILVSIKVVCDRVPAMLHVSELLTS